MAYTIFSAWYKYKPRDSYWTATAASHHAQWAVKLCSWLTRHTVSKVRSKPQQEKILYIVFRQLTKSILWCTRSNACRKSTNTPWTEPCESRHVMQVERMAMRAWLVDL